MAKKAYWTTYSRSDLTENVGFTVPSYWKIRLYLKKIVFANTDNGAVVSQPLSGGTADLLRKGKLSKNSKAAKFLRKKLKAKFDAINHVSWSNDEPNVPVKSEVSGGKAPGVPEGVEGVLLKDATMLYEIVRGTSPEARYCAVALGKGLNVAARLKNGPGLSVRCEGSELKSYEPRLAEIGFKIQSGYASKHLSGSMPDLKLCLGALLLRIGAPFTTPLPNPDVIEGKGV